jgi:hypothetical protein
MSLCWLISFNKKINSFSNTIQVHRNAIFIMNIQKLIHL